MVLAGRAFCVDDVFADSGGKEQQEAWCTVVFDSFGARELVGRNFFFKMADICPTI